MHLITRDWLFQSGSSPSQPAESMGSLSHNSLPFVAPLGFELNILQCQPQDWKDAFHSKLSGFPQKISFVSFTIDSEF
jgi:hypothetical protein